MSSIAMPAQPSARERIMAASYELFSRRGIRDVAMDDVAATSGVAKATLYRHFPSKEELALAFLDRREIDWTYGLVYEGVLSRTTDAEGRLLAIFDVLDEWFQRDDFEACSFVKVLLELGPDHQLGVASIAHLAKIRGMIADFATAAGLRDPEEFAFSMNILVKGAIVQACEGDRASAKRAKAMAALLIDSYR